jgi:hypothetical protein
MRADTPVNHRPPAAIPGVAMERNPYAPPGSAVAYEESGPPRARPVAIRRALFLMWASLVLEPVSLAIDGSDLLTQTGIYGLAITAVVVFAVKAWLIVKIGAARNWARNTYLVICVLGYGFVMLGIRDEAARAPLVAGIDLIMLGMDVGALYLVFFQGREWFKRLRV